MTKLASRRFGLEVVTMGLILEKSTSGVKRQGSQDMVLSARQTDIGSLQPKNCIVMARCWLRYLGQERPVRSGTYDKNHGTQMRDQIGPLLNGY